MDCNKFAKLIQDAFPVGSEFKNPGGGTSLITSNTPEKVAYRRGNSTIYVAFNDLFSAYNKFKGSVATSTDLRKFLPSVYDSTARPAGHSCNCTFLFEALERIGLAGRLSGRGVRGDPFKAEIL